MSNTWRRPPQNDLWQDLQALALWILIIGVAGYIIFPNFFKDIYSRLSEPVSQTSMLNNNYSLNNTTNTNADVLNSQVLQGHSFSSVTNSLYNNGNNEISSGYWIIYVSDKEFRQLAVSSEAYAFLSRIIESDKAAVGKYTVIMAARGQIQKYTVSEETFVIINNMSLIGDRSKNKN